MYASHPAEVARPPRTRDGTSRGSGTPPTLSGAVGNTPLLRLRRVASDLPERVELWAKAEFRNPTGSVKDRAAVSIVAAAVGSGELSRGRTLLDASSGNTAVAYARLGAELGFAVHLCVPANVSPERVARLRAYGARLTFTDRLEGTDGAQRAARALADSDPARYYYADQYQNPENPLAHYRTTGPEIWEQSGHRVTHFVAGVGTGGTVTGVARFLKERRASVRVVGVEPEEPLHAIEGLKHLPTAALPGTYDARVVDATRRVATETAVKMSRRLALEEGLLVGTSSGAAVAAAIALGRSLESAVIVTVLPDQGHGWAPAAPGGEEE